jgi:hypothetical protein
MKILDIRNEEDLCEKIHTVLLNNMEYVYSKNKNPQEPDFIAILTLYFTKDLFELLKNYFYNYKFAVTGIFCHQKPLVDIGESKGTELGDLLFVYKYIDENEIARYNSLLLQAKVAKNLSKVKSQDLSQFKLYSQWPEFTYCRAGSLNGERRNIYDKEPTNGAQFLLLDDNPVSIKKFPGVFPIGFSKVLLETSQYRVESDFSKDIVKFLKFENGRKFVAEDKIKTDQTNWSQMIWDLISICKNAKTKRNNIGLTDFSRINHYELNGSFMQKFNMEVNTIFNDLKDNSKNYENTEENGMPSIICIESKKIGD